MNETIIALVAYLLWSSLMVILLGSYRSVLVFRDKRSPNSFRADGSDSPALGYRIGRVFGNCVESFPILCGPMLVALATGASAITDPLAYYLLIARVGQSVTHLWSTSVLAVQVRFAFFLIQIGIAIYWMLMLLQRFAG